MRDKSGLAILPNPICGSKNRAEQPCPARLIREPNDYDNAVISVRRERTFRQCCQEVGSKKGVSARKGRGKHRKNVHFCRLQGRKPLTPMPPQSGMKGKKIYSVEQTAISEENRRLRVGWEHTLLLTFCRIIENLNFS